MALTPSYAPDFFELLVAASLDAGSCLLPEAAFSADDHECSIRGSGYPFRRCRPAPSCGTARFPDVNGKDNN